jgi:hypothetical protein
MSNKSGRKEGMQYLFKGPNIASFPNTKLALSPAKVRNVCLEDIF